MAGIIPILGWAVAGASAVVYAYTKSRPPDFQFFIISSTQTSITCAISQQPGCTYQWKTEGDLTPATALTVMPNGAMTTTFTVPDLSANSPYEISVVETRTGDNTSRTKKELFFTLPGTLSGPVSTGTNATNIYLELDTSGSQKGLHYEIACSSTVAIADGVSNFVKKDLDQNQDDVFDLVTTTAGKIKFRIKRTTDSPSSSALITATTYYVGVKVINDISGAYIIYTNDFSTT